MANTTQDASRSRSSRRWLGFSLRTLFVVVTALAVWLGYQTNRATKQRRAVERLQELQVQIIYDWQNNRGDFGTIIPNASPPAPDWLRRLVGEHYFTRVVALNFEQTETSDSDLR